MKTPLIVLLLLISSFSFAESSSRISHCIPTGSYVVTNEIQQEIASCLDNYTTCKYRVNRLGNNNIYFGSGENDTERLSEAKVECEDSQFFDGSCSDLLLVSCN